MSVMSIDIYVCLQINMFQLKLTKIKYVVKKHTNQPTCLYGIYI